MPKTRQYSNSQKPNVPPPFLALPLRFKTSLSSDIPVFLVIVLTSYSVDYKAKYLKLLPLRAGVVKQNN